MSKKFPKMHFIYDGDIIWVHYYFIENEPVNILRFNKNDKDLIKLIFERWINEARY